MSYAGPKPGTKPALVLVCTKEALMLGKALLLSLVVTNGALAASTETLSLTLNLPSYQLEV